MKPPETNRDEIVYDGQQAPSFPVQAPSLKEGARRCAAIRPWYTPSFVIATFSSGPEMYMSTMRSMCDMDSCGR